MRVDLSKVITRLNGLAVPDGDAPKNSEGKLPSLTVASAIVTALTVVAEGDGKERYRRFKLALAIDAAAKDGMAEISVEDAATIKAAVGAAWPPFVVGPVYDALEAAATPTPAAS